MKTTSEKLRGFLVAIFCALAFCGGAAFAEDPIHETDARVAPQSDLTYYIDVTYDGKDKGSKSEKGKETNATDTEDTTADTTANIKSGYISVEDKLPAGLVFKGFVENEGGIGATCNGETCSGNVVQDSENIGGTTYNDEDEYVRNGIHYTKSDRTVRFTVNALQAGGKLTVGVITTTPSVEAEERKDFYNIATAQESTLSKRSNVAHVYIEGESAPESDLHTVKYQYAGIIIPDGAQDILPSDAEYPPGTDVGVAAPINIMGYTFSGWVPVEGLSNGDINVVSFTMPSSNVVFEGSFTKINPYKVKYEINGEKPENFVVPSEKSYYADEYVTVDSLAQGDEVGEYIFSGWGVKSGGVTISDEGVFVMPGNDVALQGSFERKKYNVTYEFYNYDNVVLPPEPNHYLPGGEAHFQGDNVAVATSPIKTGTIITGSDNKNYKFLGWDRGASFNMPGEDVVIRGEWMLVQGVFEPQISKEIVDKKESYKAGDMVEYKITVINPYDFAIKDVTISENNGKAKFVSREGYNLVGDNLAEISSVPASGSVVLYANYIVSENDFGTIENEVEFVAGIGENGYTLNDGIYKAVSEFDVTSDEPEREPSDGGKIETEHHEAGTEHDVSSLTDDDSKSNLDKEENTSKGPTLASDSSPAETRVGEVLGLSLKTGDETNVYVYLTFVFASMICLIAIIKFGKPQEANHKIH